MEITPFLRFSDSEIRALEPAVVFIRNLGDEHAKLINSAIREPMPSYRVLALLDSIQLAIDTQGHHIETLRDHYPELVSSYEQNIRMRLEPAQLLILGALVRLQKVLQFIIDDQLDSITEEWEHDS